MTSGGNDNSQGGPGRWRSIGLWVGLVGIALAVWFKLGDMITGAVNSALRDEAVVSRIAQRVRPALIFDDTGRIEANQGAVELVQNLSVSPGPGEGDLVFTISFTEYLEVEPILESLDGYHTIHARRGEMLEWVFEAYEVTLLAADGGGPPRDHYRFRLELIR